MTSKATQALMTIANFPITDPKNMDAVTMKKIAEEALSTGQKTKTKKKVRYTLKEPNPDFNTEIEKKVLQIFVDTLGFDEREIKLNSDLKIDLHVDDLDSVELQMHLEEQFNHEIKDSVMNGFKTPKDIIDFINQQEAK